MNTNRNLPSLHQSLIERRNLLEKLKVATQHKLTLVIAPPGYGKTTLISQFGHETVIPFAWHSLEKNEQDVSNLFTHCLDALVTVCPEVRSINPSGGTTAGELATLITTCLRDFVKTDFIYVIDDIHYLLEAYGAKTWLRAFIATLPSTCHLVLMGRTFPPLSVTEMFARGEIVTIGQEQLSFSIEEVKALAERVGAILPIVQIEKIFSRMRGWPAGTRLALQPLSSDIESLLFDGEKGPEGLFDALASHLFRSQSSAMQTFLLSSSTLSRMTPTLCQNALRITNSFEYFTEALQRNLFISEISGGIAYHSLFRDFLQRQLQKQNPALFIRHHADAGEWFESENRLDEAFEHYVAANCWEQAANIAERSAHLYLGKPETLLRWEYALKNTKLQIPRFHHMCATIHKDRYEYELAIANADAAEIGFQTRNDRKGLAQIVLFRATIDNQRGSFQEALNKAEPYSRDLSIPANLRGYALAIMGTAALYLQKFDDAIPLLETALPMWRETGDQFAIAQLLLTNGLLYSRLGRFFDASKYVQESISIRRSFGEAVGIGMALNNLGYQYHLLGEYDRALQTLQEGLQVMGRIPENRAESHILSTMADLLRDQGDFNKASLLYQKSLEIIGDSEPVLQATVLMGFATLRRWEGQLDQAQQLAIKAQSVAQQHHLNWEATLASLVLQAIRIHQGEFNAVQQDLETIIVEWTRRPAPQFAYALGIYAHAALVSGDNQTAHRYLKVAIVNANHLANLQPLIAEISHTPLLKAFIERHADRYEILHQGIRKLDQSQIHFNDIQNENSSLNVRRTYSLKVSVLGRERIERDGRQIPSSDWQAASARELFFYLLFRKASSREEIGLALWPDSSMQQIRQKFHITLHRTREAVGSNVIIFENDLYFINPQLDLWCDVNEFEIAIKQAQLSSFHLAHTEMLWQRAVDLFAGELLSAFDASWIIAYREKLSQMYLTALLSLAKCVRLRDDLQKSIELLKCALEVDPYREDIHRLLLKDYHSLGERSLIIRHMKYLIQLFQDELGAKLSPETLSLAKTLED